MGRKRFFGTSYDGSDKNLKRPLAVHLGYASIRGFGDDSEYVALGNLSTSKNTPEIEQLYVTLSNINYLIRIASWYE